MCKMIPNSLVRFELFYVLFVLGLSVFCNAVEYEDIELGQGRLNKMEEIAGVANHQSQIRVMLDRMRRALSKNATTTQNPMTFPKNNTEILSNHTYYMSTYKQTPLQKSKYFTDLKDLMAKNNTNVSLTGMKTPVNPGAIGYFEQKLKFTFPFYGHEVSSVVVTATGFLHVGPIVHNYAHDVHYIAPLMANFSPQVNETLKVYSYDDGERFIVQWESAVENKNYTDSSNASAPDTFTFQVSVFKNGTMVFAYKTIPYNLSMLSPSRLTPKVGLSDGYVYQYYIYVGRRPPRRRYGPFRFIYRYHVVSLPKKKVQSDSVYVLTPILNCITAKSCNACFSDDIAKNFKCKWCPKLNMCSDSLDWHRQLWYKSGCGINALSNKASCNAPPTTRSPRKSTNRAQTALPQKKGKGKSKKTAVGAVIGVLLLVISLIIGAVLLYGYRNPMSKIGMFMIRNRPAKLFGRL